MSPGRIHTVLSIAVITALYLAAGVGAVPVSAAWAAANGNGNGSNQARNWRNSLNVNDVNGDGAITIIDVQTVITFLNMSGSGPVEDYNTAVPLAPPYLDTNGDGFVAPIDALQVINWLNAN